MLKVLRLLNGVLSWSGRALCVLTDFLTFGVHRYQDIIYALIRTMGFKLPEAVGKLPTGADQWNRWVTMLGIAAFVSRPLGLVMSAISRLIAVLSPSSAWAVDCTSGALVDSVVNKGPPGQPIFAAFDRSHVFDSEPATQLLVQTPVECVFFAAAVFDATLNELRWPTLHYSKGHATSLRLSTAASRPSTSAATPSESAGTYGAGEGAFVFVRVVSLSDGRAFTETETEP